MSDVNDTLNERGGRYGKFSDNALLAEQIMDTISCGCSWPDFTASQRVAAFMIIHKLARAASGDPEYDDNWRDIAGYATIIVEQLNGVDR